LTLPLRLIGALMAAPFALHNKPLGAILGFAALFGFWEIWDGFVKQPILSLYQAKSVEYQAEALAKDPNSTGDVLNSNYKAAKWLVGVPFKAMFGAHESDTARKKIGALAATPDSAVQKLSNSINRTMNEERQKISVLPSPENLDKDIKKG